MSWKILKTIFKPKNKKPSESVARANFIQKELADTLLKPYGFVKKGRRLYNKKTDDGLTLVIKFQIGAKYPEDNWIYSMWVGVRIPECCNRTFSTIEEERFFHEYECNVRNHQTDFPLFDNCHCLSFRHQTNQEIIDFLTNYLTTFAFPLFDAFASRDLFLKHSRNPQYIPLLDVQSADFNACFIYGARGKLDKAKTAFDTYYNECLLETTSANKNRRNAAKGHLQYLDNLRNELGI